MGQVWRVENVPLQRESALKLIKPGIAQNDKGWQRFEREARLMAKITHLNAVGVYDFRRTHSMGYIEMEFVPGTSLHDFLKRRKGEPMPLEWIAQFLDQLCSVLHVAHGHVDKKTGKARPIIHRDLKPSNLMLAEDRLPGQELKVLDFGIAKIAQDEGSPELTGVGDFLGTPDYMSPEQIRGGITKEGKGDIDGRSDLYSTGVMLYQLLTGSLPFPKMNKMALLGAHLHGTPMPMKEANPAAQVPPKVERLVMRCLEKDPDLRPQTARELAEQFRKAIAGVVPEPEKPRRKPPLLPIAAVCALVAGLTITSLWQRSGGGVGPGEPVENKEHKVPIANGGAAGGASSTTSGPRGSVKTQHPTPMPLTWVPDGYKVAEDLEPPPGAPSGMACLRRDSDKVEFYPLKTGAYLPFDYEPESLGLDDLVEGIWPPVIVRKLDKKVRFIRIPGKVYRRGDPKASTGPLARHWVRVSGFYIQETEVTNAEIERWFRDHTEAAASERAWREYYNKVRKDARPVEKAEQYPAASISYVTARLYARDMGGRLPTEAQWELAAKSCNDEYVLPWGKDLPGNREKLKANFWSSTRAIPLGPVEVKTVFTDDRTEQGVYDMAGNVRELCIDPFRTYEQFVPPNTSPKNPLDDRYESEDPRTDAGKYVVRGGMYSFSPDRSKVYKRDEVTAEETAGYIGFRLVITCPSVSKSAE
jgi:serine/threonine-protein kinase